MFTPQTFSCESTITAPIDVLAMCGESEAFRAADPTLDRPTSPELLRVLRRHPQDEDTVVVASPDDTTTRELVRGRLFETGSDPCIVCESPLARDLHELAPTSLMFDTVPDAFAPRPFDSFAETVAAPLRRPIPHVFALAHRPPPAAPAARALLLRVVVTTFAVLATFALVCAALHAVIEGTLTLASFIAR